VGMNGGPETLGIQVSVGADADAHELADATSHLRRELVELDVEAVEPARAGEPPPGVRAIDFAAIGTLVVALAKSELLTAVLSAIRSWLQGHHGRSVKLEFDGDVLS
jgi:O-acetyl-ADP-ribose deacetylase (regulator of RNase III)